MKTIKILILSILVLSINLFAAGVATITALKGSASIQRDATTLEASIGTELEQKDLIKTKENSKLQIIFKDETIITLGKNSNFSIEEYLFEDNQKPVAKFGMIKGAMRTITGRIGKIAPEKFIVKTKTATIGIRGTNFAVVVGEDGSYQAYCTYGAISVTINGEVHIVKQGFFISISPTGKVEIKEFTAQDLKEMKKKNFNGDSDKIGQAKKDSIIKLAEDGENGEQLNVTITDYSSIAVKDLTDTTINNIQSGAGVENYIMNDALYTGTYTSTTYTGMTGLPASGSANLAVDFGADTASLTLDGGTALFNQNPAFTESNFNLDQSGGAGSASGTFQGETGNSATGNFNYKNSGYEDIGTYDVSTSQTLY